MQNPSSSVPGPRIAIACALLAAVAVGCGAKTGLDTPDVTPDVTIGPDSGDAGPDAMDAPPPVVVCSAIRVHSSLGFVTSLRPNASALFRSGYVWTLTSRPAGSTARVVSDGTATAVITPDMVGEFDILVTVPAPRPAGGMLQCAIVVIADAPDPQCPGYALTEPVAVPIPNGDMQIGYDVVWGQPRTTVSGATGAVFADDTAARVATVVFERPTHIAGHDPLTTLQLEGEAVESTLMSSTVLQAVPVLVGRTGTTHEAFGLRRSTFRVTPTNSTDPGALRNEAALAAGQISAPGGAPAQSPALDFYLEVATILRADTGHVVVGMTVSPVVAFDDSSMSTAIRVEDFANATSIARAGSSIDVRCHSVTATRVAKVDFLWLVDTTEEMRQYQLRIGNAAQSFFQSLRSAGVDFRVGVIEAGNVGPILEGINGSGPFQWIAGNDPMGATLMAWEVTIDQYPGEPASGGRAPFPTNETTDGDGHEEPIAQSILSIQEFERRARTGETNPNFLLRSDAVTAVFYVTVEGASDDDYEAFFQPHAADWGTTAAAITSAVVSFYRTRNVLPFGLVPVDAGMECPNIPGLAACIISASGGAYAPINAGGDLESDRQIQTAIQRVAETVSGASSEFVLPVIPISSSLRARVDGRLTPRSRVDGFDYDDRANALVLRGPTFHPQVGQQVQTAYFIWRP